ncbi:MAG: hypothetical protein EBU54_16135 [Mycobacteriaceae bacterium]|nr:hypothetical protein [Mycobacteriaceae bacterium]
MTAPGSPTTRRRTAVILGALAAPLIAAGLLLGSSATAAGQPASETQCSSMTSSMTVPTSQAGVTPNGLTRAGQIGSAAATGTPAGSMPVDCTAASHG